MQSSITVCDPAFETETNCLSMNGEPSFNMVCVKMCLYLTTVQ